MSENDTCYCKIFVDTVLSKDELARTIARVTNGHCIRRTVYTSWGEIDVVLNEDFDDHDRFNSSDGFLHYQFYLEIEADVRVSRFIFVSSIANLLTEFWRMEFKAVAACDFEHELPRKGGLTS
ncbi:hypothetical protein Pan216_32590 [Planctomycetes bacterium Pan216]|uniref:Uncharacterized protein n=1 Tax=Kolteria novifilia TaxID=2527975 RepID=A0A518B639_9BACT|nr:hypothetical protein Pan216_32590 [Planctomycetes bacterium Pan216]